MVCTGKTCITGPVITGTPVKCITTSTTFKGIITGIAFQVIHTMITNDFIIVSGTLGIFKVKQYIRLVF